MKNTEMNKALHIDEGMTLPQAKGALIEAVMAFNNSTDSRERGVLQIKAERLAEKFNELSLLTLYAEAMNDEFPLAYVVKAHHYTVARVKFAQAPRLDLDGKMTVTITGTCEFFSTKGAARVDMAAFIKWAESMNKKVTASGDWKTRVLTAAKNLNQQFDASMRSDDVHTISKNEAGKAIQESFDALLMIPGKSGKNSIIPNKDCKNLIVSCAAEYREKITESNDVNMGLSFLTDKHWMVLIQRSLYMILKNKTLTYSFGSSATDDEEENPETSGDKGAKPEKK